MENFRSQRDSAFQFQVSCSTEVSSESCPVTFPDPKTSFLIFCQYITALSYGIISTYLLQNWRQSSFQRLRVDTAWNVWIWKKPLLCLEVLVSPRAHWFLHYCIWNVLRPVILIIYNGLHLRNCF